MLVFLDFEASSLSKQSYPVEVAWVFEDGQSRAFLITPAPDWTDWSSEAEAIHGISRELLEKEGVAVSIIADEMVDPFETRSLRERTVMGREVAERPIAGSGASPACTSTSEIR